MSITKNEKINQSSIKGWESLIRETRNRIERLQIAIEVFEENIRIGHPYEPETAETNRESVSHKATYLGTKNPPSLAGLEANS